MKVIILKPIPGHSLGIAEVSKGYGRYLIREGIGTYANAFNENLFKKERARLEQRETDALNAARDLQAKLDGKSLLFTNAVGAEGKLFGSIVIKDIVKNIKDTHNIEVHSRQVILPTPLKSTGVHKVTIRLHTGVEAQVLVSIARSYEEAEAAIASHIATSTPVVEIELEVLLPIPPFE